MTPKGVVGGWAVLLQMSLVIQSAPVCEGYMSQNRKCLEQCLGMAYKLEELYIAERDCDHMQFTHDALAAGPGCHC